MGQRKIGAASALPCALLAAVIVVLAGCANSNEAVCGGSPLKAPVDLPIHWPQFSKLTYTKQAKDSGTFVVDGYFGDGLHAAHDGWKKALEAEGFTILSDELGNRDSEISWKGEASSGRVTIGKACGSSRKVWIHITNRTA